MSTDAIKIAADMSNGARFYRCALQVNPHHYASTFRGATNRGDATSHAADIVDKAVVLGISVLAITDHNDVSGVPAFREAVKGREVTIFPGFELTSSEGVHVLCIFPEDTDDDKLGRYLGEFGITNTEPSVDLADKSLVAILEKVRVQGGVTVAAHATNSGGLFRVLSGQPCIKAWQDRNMRAIQIPGAVSDLLPETRQIVENKNVDYRLASCVDDDLAIAVINAKDIAKSDDLIDPSASCWIKMSRISIEGLRQAFLDPGSRIRLNPKSGKIEPEKHAELVAVAWEGGGFLDGAMVHFNSNLNVLVGGRGTGKSTIIESIRAVLSTDIIGPEAQKAHDGIVRQVLRSGTKISLLVRAHRPTLREYRIERTLPNPAIVRDAQGVSNLTPHDVLPRVEVYGQHEISELTKSGEKLTRLLERFVEKDEKVSQKKSDARRDLEKNRRDLIEIRGELQQVEERLAALPALEEMLKRFREAGVEERLKERSLFVREERVLDSIPERLSPFRDLFGSLKEKLPLDRSFLSMKELAELPSRDILAKGSIVLEQLERDFQRILRSAEEALTTAEKGIEEVRAVWETGREKVQSAYEKILRELQKFRVDGEEFIRLRRQFEELRPLNERRVVILRAEREHADRRKALLVDWEDLKAEEFRHFDRAAKKVSLKLRSKVQVEVTAAGDREPLFQILRDHIGGRLSEAIDVLRSVPELSLTKFVESCRKGATALTEDFDIPPAQADRISKAAPEVLMRLEELELQATTVVRLNTVPTGSSPTWQELSQLSTGQKATAVLLLLLLESDAPLIVDQPEDDLDNRFITEGIVPRMRKEKQRRQFIFSTHNANIPVLGDAELIVGLSASGEAEHGRASLAPEHMGSIDDPLVRELVEEILEGGKEAFERRRGKYGF